MVSEPVAEVMESGNGLLNGLSLPVWSERKCAGQVRPKPGQLLRDQEAPEAEAQLADRLPFARALALLLDASPGSGDVTSRPVAQLTIGIVQPRCFSAEAKVAHRKLSGKRVPQGDLKVANWLPERGGDRGIPAI